MRALDVGIVGCGFAGAATAALLGRAGHRVTVYEEFAEPSAVGAGIVLQPTGLSVLAELGVLGRVLDRGARLESLDTQRRVFIGDAAHAMSPQLGQGTNLALMDASALCTALAQEVPLAIALERYSRARRAQIDFYQFASRWLTPLFQSDLHALGPLRNAVMSSICQLPLLRDEMLRTMSGIKCGIARPSLALQPILGRLPAPG